MSVDGTQRARTATDAQDGQGADESWQLRMLSVSLEKQQKLALLLDQIGDVSGQDCLLITHGDNSGALNHRFREHGGSWSWMECESDHIEEMQALLGETVQRVEPDALPAAAESFDLVVSIDVHEHLEDCAPFVRELQRVIRGGGRAVVTTPNGDAWKPVTVLKHLVGMRKEKYGHRVIGYNARQHDAMLREAGFEPESHGSYSHFFTEMIELAINFAYVVVLQRRQRDRREGAIAPGSSGELKSVEKQYRLYRRVYPLLNAVASLDRLLSALTGYAVSVVARKPGAATP